MKLDYSMKGETERRKHDKRSERHPLQTVSTNLSCCATLFVAVLCPKIDLWKHLFVYPEVKKEVEEGDEPRAETGSESEEELSCFAPTVWPSVISIQ